MTDKVHASFGRIYRSREMAAVRGFALADVVIPNTDRLVEDSEGNLTTGALNAFNYVSASGLDVTIDTGEAVVGGAYLATDDQHTITVTDDTTTTVYVGWKDGQADTVIVGTSGDFTSDDPKTAIWDITAASGAVTGQSDQRNTDDYRVSAPNLQVDAINATDLAVGSLADNEVLQRRGSSLVGGELWPVHIYGDGNDGAITRSANANENGVITATTYTVDAGVTLSVTSGLLVIMATDSITINGTIDASATGANGGGGGNGNNNSSGGGGNNGGKGGSGWLNPNGTGGSGGNGNSNRSNARTNGGAGGDGDTASMSARAYLFSQPVDAAFWADDKALLAGAGGGGGGGGSSDGNVSSYSGNGNNGSVPGGGGGGEANSWDDTSGDGGAGGVGGGMVLLIAPTISGSGTINVSGGPGSNGQSGGGGNGGGGGGGTAGTIGYFGLDIDRSSITETNSGGAGGSGSGAAGDGATGGTGWTFAVTP